MFGEKGREILKLPPVRICFTIAITNNVTQYTSAQSILFFSKATCFV